MVDRISSLQFFNQGVSTLSQRFADTVATQAQIASGRRVNTAADDPVAAARILQLEQEQALRQQYLSNIDNASSRIELQDSQLQAVVDDLARVRVLTVQAGSGTLSSANRAAIATELESVQQDLLALFNSRDADGEYLFSGFQGGTRPFEQLSTSVFDYRGDAGQREVQISSASTILVSDSGQSLFVDIDAGRNTFLSSSASSNTGDAGIFNTSVVDQPLFDQAFPEDYNIVFNSPSDVTPAAANFTVSQKSDGRVLLANALYEAGEPISFNGLELSISGNPAEGDVFAIESTNKQGILTTVGKLIEGFGAGSTLDSAGREQLVANTLTSLDNIEENLGFAQASLGGRLSTLDTTAASLESIGIITDSRLSELRDLDLTEAISRLSFQNVILQAAQQSYATVSRISLFNFIR